MTKKASIVAWLCRALLFCILAVVYAQRAFWHVLKSGRTLCTHQKSTDTAAGKKPSQLRAISLVISQTELNPQDFVQVTRIVSWCFNSGINYCFVHDPFGILKRSKDKFVQLLQSENPDLSFHLEVGWAQTVVTGIRNRAGLPVVHLLDKNDALTPLLHVASNPLSTQENDANRTTKGYAGLEDVDQYWSSSLSLDELRNEIVAIYGTGAILEPDVILVTGPVFSLAFSPPWHSRFSEIYYLGELHKVKFRQFSKTLNKFWRTHQRFGT